MISKKSNKGFTLVELSLVMAFLSLLLLAILFSTIHISKIYAKGVTNRQINQVGRELVDTMRRDFLVADAARITSYVSGGNKSGRICLGKVSYVWNTAATLAAGEDSNTIKDKDGSTPVVFSRVIDSGGSLCSNITGNYPTSLVGVGDETEILSSEGRTLAVYDLSFTQLTRKGSDGLYTVDITVGTNDPSSVDSSTMECRPPSDHSSNFEYCSVAEFSIIVRTGGESK